MIIYFSATGNCKYVASRISEKTGDKLLSIIKCNKENIFTINLDDDEDLGIVIPTYFWGVPELVKTFLKKLIIKTDNDNPYIYVVSTYGTSPGASIAFVESIINEKQLKINSKYSLQMADTWTVTFDLSKQEYIDKFTKTTENKLSLIIDSILNHENANLTEKTKNKFFGTIAQAAYNLERKTNKFTVDDNCISCGMCARDCPIDAININNDKPEWIKDKCLICFRCLHRCPTVSIEFNHKTREHGQYTNPNIDVFD